MALEWVKVKDGREVLVDTTKVALPPSKGPFVRADHLSLKERRGLRLQLGRDFDSRSQLEAYMKDNDFRHVDKGDRQDRARKRMKEWVANTKPGERGRPSFTAKDRA